MAGGVGHDELATIRREETIGNVNGNALLALRGKAIDQQGEINAFALRAETGGIGLQGGQLVLEDHFRLVQHSPDQRGLAIINTAAGDEAQKRFFLMALQIGENILGNQVGLVGHQKYPSCFFFSIDAD